MNKKQNTKGKITKLFVFSAIVMGIVVLLVLNISANLYIDITAKNTLKKSVERFSTFNKSLNTNDINGEGVIVLENTEKNIKEPKETNSTNAGIAQAFSEEKKSIFNVNFLWYDNIYSDFKQKSQDYKVFISKTEMNIYKYYINNKKNYNIKMIKTGGEIFYTVFLNSDKSDMENVALYINVSEFKMLVRNMNFIFVPIFMLVIISMAFLGIKEGEKLEKSQQKVKQFFQNASHELKTPLTCIQGYAEGINTGIIKDEKMASGIILNQSEKMKKMIDELLTLSKLESGEFNLEKVEVKMDKFIYGCLSYVEHLTDINKIKIELEIEKQLPEIFIDKQQLEKVFITIFENAGRYANSNISVIVKKRKNNIRIKIEDDGSGIDNEDLPHIFKRFYAGKNGNTGIGLAMAKEIIELHGGVITAKNGKEGAIFIIDLPVS